MLTTFIIVGFLSPLAVLVTIFAAKIAERFDAIEADLAATRRSLEAVSEALEELQATTWRPAAAVEAAIEHEFSDAELDAIFAEKI